MTTLADLRALAEQATPGPWHSILPGDVRWSERHKYRCVAFGKRDSAYTTSALQPPDARYIAACSPEVITALVVVAEAAEGMRRYALATGVSTGSVVEQALDALLAVLDA